jgi:hypothetical protein
MNALPASHQKIITGQKQLEVALRHALRSPLKKYKRGHFAALTKINSPAARPR